MKFPSSKTLSTKIFLLLFGCLLLSMTQMNPNPTTRKVHLSRVPLYFGVGTVLGSLSRLTHLAWGFCQIFPRTSTFGNECLLLSNLCYTAAHHSFAQMFKTAPRSFDGTPHSQRSWHHNQTLLSQTPAYSDDQKQLLSFLEKRWLSKANGFFTIVINWVCPCFDIDVQVHPESTSSYARDPATKASLTYRARIERWKQTLPQPQEFPLILTRPFDVQDYLPSYAPIPHFEEIETIVEKSASTIESSDSKVVLDLTHLFAKEEEWHTTWEKYRDRFSQALKKISLSPNQVVCIQRMQENEIGGIRLLPLVEDVDAAHHFLLEWVSVFGLSANQIELDRNSQPSSAIHSQNVASEEGLTKD